MALCIEEDFYGSTHGRRDLYVGPQILATKTVSDQDPKEQTVSYAESENILTLV